MERIEKELGERGGGGKKTAGRESDENEGRGEMEQKRWHAVDVIGQRMKRSMRGGGGGGGGGKEGERT